MHYEITKLPVKHPLLKNFIRFFWEIHINNIELNHILIPQKNINLRFNLSETPQFITRNGEEQLLDNVFFSGLHDHFGNSILKLNGKVDMLGICFYPQGFYPFWGIPVAEFKNQILGAGQVGFNFIDNLTEQLKEAPDVSTRLDILENALLLLLKKGNSIPENFNQIFNSLKQSYNSKQIAEFCRQNNIGIRKLERMFNKYVGVPAMTYVTLHRFHSSMNQLLYQGNAKLTEIAYDNQYFDQMHFIRDFKRFAGNTPKSFVHQKNSILQIGKLS